MLKIGDFSRLSRVTVKTLHHYDDIGLLKPAHTDRFTNHRFYEPEQLVHIHRIMALKDLGFSLEQIRLTVNEGLEISELRGMLRLKKAETLDQLREAQSKLTNVEFRLRMLEMEESFPEVEIVFKQVPALKALTLRTSIRKEMLVRFGLEFERVQEENHIKLSGPIGEIRYEKEFEPGHVDVEFYFPVEDWSGGKLKLGDFGYLNFTTLPEISAASFMLKGTQNMHQGTPPQILEDSFIVLQRWLVANDYQLGGVNRTIFHHGPIEHAEYEDWVIEIQHEVARPQRSE